MIVEWRIEVPRSLLAMCMDMFEAEFPVEQYTCFSFDTTSFALIVMAGDKYFQVYVQYIYLPIDISNLFPMLYSFDIRGYEFYYWILHSHVFNDNENDMLLSGGYVSR